MWSLIGLQEEGSDVTRALTAEPYVSHLNASSEAMRVNLLEECSLFTGADVFAIHRPVVEAWVVFLVKQKVPFKSFCIFILVPNCAHCRSL